MDRKLADDFRLFEQILVDNDSADDEEDNLVRLKENAKTKDTKIKTKDTKTKDTKTKTTKTKPTKTKPTKK
jgi:hypothetical protein